MGCGGVISFLTKKGSRGLLAYRLAVLLLFTIDKSNRITVPTSVATRLKNQKVIYARRERNKKEFVIRQNH